jgi:hypothetical protein
MSVCNILSTNTLGAGTANITTLAAGGTTLGATTTATLTNTGLLSNNGAISTNTLGVGGNSLFSGTLGVAGLATFGNTSNIGTLGVAGLATFGNTSNTGTLGVGGTTTLSVLNTTSISNTGNISTNSLVTDSAFLSSLTLYDPIHLSTGTFRYSTLTTLFALPNTSLLYFNNLVIGGAYVWPGQTIQALNWTGGCNEQTITPFILVDCNITASNYYIVSNVTGGTPPYTLIETGSSLLTGESTTTALSTNTSSALSGANFGQIRGQSQSNFFGNINIRFTLTDSSTPMFVRYLTLTI